MHWLGKVLAWGIGVLALAAWYLTSMLYDAQGKWQQQVETRQATRADLMEQLRTEEMVVSDLEADVNRTMMPWGRAWELGPQQVQLLDPEQGTVLLGVGLNGGLALRESSQGKPLPTVYLFGKEAGDKSIYLGAFRITAVEQDRATAQLIRTPNPGEVDEWQRATEGVRVWEGIPSNWRSLHASLQAQNAVAMQEVVDHQARLETQKELTAKSQEHLERRMNQLHGHPNPLEGAGQDTLDGLVLALRKEETVRNGQLQTLDQLRHEYNAKYNQLMELLERNRTLEGQLPAAETGGPAGPALGAAAEPDQRR